jgi:hypothetical protein
MRRYYQTYNTEDPAALAAFYHDDVILTNGDIRLGGRSELLATYANMIEQFHDKMTPLYIEESAESVTVDIMDRLTAKRDIDNFLGDSMSIGEHRNLKLRGTYRFTDGKISSISLEQVQ